MNLRKLLSLILSVAMCMNLLVVPGFAMKADSNLTNGYGAERSSGGGDKASPSEADKDTDVDIPDKMEEDKGETEDKGDTADKGDTGTVKEEASAVEPVEDKSALSDIGLADHVVISQVYGGGGNSGCIWKSDFIELYNPTDEDINLEGWSIQWLATNTFASPNIQLTNLSGTIEAGGYYLIKEADGNNKEAPELPEPDVEGSINMAATGGAAALSKSSERLSGKDDENFVDLVGVGAAKEYETQPTAAMSNSTAAIRKDPAVDTDNNSADFKIGKPEPHNSSYEEGGNQPEETKCKTPVATPAAGPVLKGTQLTFSTATSDAVIEYNTESNAADEWIIYSNADKLMIDEPVTYYVRAVKDGLEDSEIAEFSYTIREAGKVMTIKDVLALGQNTKDVTVTGELSYLATTYGNPVLQSEIDGSQYSIYIYGAAPDDARIGDILEITGDFQIRYGMPQITSTKDKAKIAVKQDEATIPPVKYTVSQIKAMAGTADIEKSGLINRVVLIEDVKLGKLNTSGSTPVTDATGTIDIYQAAPYPEGVEEGETVDLTAMIGRYNQTIQLYTGTEEKNGFPVYYVKNDTKPPVITLGTYIDARPDQEYPISVQVRDNVGVASVEVLFGSLKAMQDKSMSMTFNQDTNNYEAVIPAENFAKGQQALYIKFKAKDKTGLESESGIVTIAINDKPQVLAVTPERNKATGDVKAPEISIKLANSGNNPSVSLTLSKSDGTAIYTDQSMNLKETAADGTTYAFSPKVLEDGTYNAQVTVVREDKVSFTENWKFTIGKSSFTAYFGQLHGHTNYSDGSGSVKDGLNYLANIPEEDNVQFVSFTDHSNYFDTKDAPNPKEALNDPSLMTSESRAIWEEYREQTRSFNETSTRKALSGFEMTWSGGPGHINTFGSAGLVSRNNTTLNDKKNDAGLKAYYDILTADSDPLANLSQFNHPGKTFGTFSDFAYYTPARDAKMVLVEVGNGEGSIGSGGYFPSYNEYTKALDKGWHLAPSNNQDNHKGRWGNANTARTVVITDDLSETGILSALKDMHVYATEDKNLNIMYTLNDQLMGSILDVSDDVKTLNISVSVDDPDPSDIIKSVEVVTNGGAIAGKKEGTGNSGEFTFELPAKKGYYYIRVTQADKNIAVTAPVWYGSAAKAGISSFTCDTDVPVTGDPVKFTVTAFNNEESDATLTKLTFKTGDKVLESEDLNVNLKSFGTYTVNKAFILDKVGVNEIEVTAQMELEGDRKIFSFTLEIDIRDSSKMKYFGIDASHYNEYVNGNYKDSMGNFTALAGDYNIRMVTLYTSEELIAALKDDKYVGILINAPSRRDGTKLREDYKNYTEGELDAVRAFAKKGGKTIMVCAWSDTYEAYDGFKGDPSRAEDHMSAQQNKILEALGSSFRFADDELQSDSSNDGRVIGILSTDYNQLNPYMTGVDAGLKFNTYGNADIYAVDESGTPVRDSAMLPSGAAPLVYAPADTKSLDKDGVGLSGDALAKLDGRFVLAATQELYFSDVEASTLYLSGCSTMSDFQLTFDSAATNDYSNYQIMANLLEKTNQLQITPIREVQAAGEGERFIIEGIATSNASGYDKETAFFDSIYVQDYTGGINLFPVSGDIRAGQTIRVFGKTSSYQGERQLAVEKIMVIDPNITELPVPVKETTKEAYEGKNLGSLVMVSGKVISIDAPNNLVETIMLQDQSGKPARIFIDGYITKDKVIKDLKIGAYMSAVGLSSRTVIGDSEDSVSRIRIRDRDDVKLAEEPGNPENPENPENPGNPENPVKPERPSDSDRDRDYGTVTKSLVQSYNVEWKQNARGWQALKKDGTYAANEWYQCSYNGQVSWYRFDTEGYMVTGWYLDADGSWYYMSENHDGTFGAMVTGWRWINGKCYCFNPDILAAQYKYGAMLKNTTTTDGYAVNANGEWIVDGVVQIR
ncbi:CehA/McbA family metallohydrolase [Lacrimispora sp.]|uniref:CehA/McbA family metallohydrolase n=1 Tax=Lacrimispora sp. TaxID=2719234 RepID=UPI0028A771D5|nr:CehA/McbA family metallohydrolase [Lacrimispora sp.]